jgi:site-specific DNA-methyltransferase (adenine-specific)
MIGEYKLNEIYNEDSYEAIKKIPDKSVDLILTDPPYGINADMGVGGFGNSPKNAKKYSGGWDNKTPSEDMFKELLRVGKKVIIFGANYFTDKLPLNGHWIVWDKVGEIKFNNPYSDCELAWTNVDKKIVKKYLNKQQGFINDGDERVHPTQKPLRLFSEIIRDYSNENDIVADFFLGSGTTCVAAKELNRRYIGFEIDKEYYKIAKDRLNGITANGQTSIFTDFKNI